MRGELRSERGKRSVRLLFKNPINIPLRKSNEMIKCLWDNLNRKKLPKR